MVKGSSIWHYSQADGLPGLQNRLLTHTYWLSFVFKILLMKTSKMLFAITHVPSACCPIHLTDCFLANPVRCFLNCMNSLSSLSLKLHCRQACLQEAFKHFVNSDLCLYFQQWSWWKSCLTLQTYIIINGVARLRLMLWPKFSGQLANYLQMKSESKF